MFARISKIKQGKNTYRYLRIVEAYRHEGRCRQRVVANLGPVDLLGDKVDRVVLYLGKHSKNPLTAPDQIECKEALIWGSVLLARYLAEQVNLPEIIKQHCQSPRQKYDVAETAFVLITNRLCEPSSEHGLARWMEHTFVCDRHGKRWQPQWLAAERITKQQRVKVDHRQLNRWYRTLDALLAAKEKIEEALYLHVRNLFNLKVDTTMIGTSQRENECGS
jgi:hypothetical protein